MARGDVDVNAPVDKVDHDPNNRSAINYAAFYGRVSAIQVLLERDDVDVNSVDASDRSPLINAIGDGGYAPTGGAAMLLLTRAKDYIDVNIKDENIRCSESEEVRTIKSIKKCKV